LFSDSVSEALSDADLRELLDLVELRAELFASLATDIDRDLRTEPRPLCSLAEDATLEDLVELVADCLASLATDIDRDARTELRLLTSLAEDTILEDLTEAGELSVFEAISGELSRTLSGSLLEAFDEGDLELDFDEDELLATEAAPGEGSPIASAFVFEALDECDWDLVFDDEEALLELELALLLLDRAATVSITGLLFFFLLLMAFDSTAVDRGDSSLGLILRSGDGEDFSPNLPVIVGDG